MILMDGIGLYCVSSTCYFCDKSIEVSRISSDEGKGYRIVFIKLDIEVRLYKSDARLEKKHITKFSDEEIEELSEKILQEHLSKVPLKELTKWIEQKQALAANQREYEVKQKIRESLGF